MYPVYSHTDDEVGKILIRISDSKYAMLSDTEVRKYLTDLGSEWEIKDGKVVKSFQFSSFMDAIEFVNKVAKVAEELDHHPIITVNWKTVRLSLKSFDIDAISNRDINLAKKIQELSTAS